MKYFSHIFEKIATFLQQISALIKSEAATGGILWNKVFLKISGKQLCQSLFFNNVAGFCTATLLKRGSRAGKPMNFVKFL